MAPSDRAQTVTIEGRPVRLTSLDRVVYAQTETTKADIIDYYRQIAPVMLPHCSGRPVTRKRWPRGVDAAGGGDMFFQKDLGDGAPEWVATAPLQHADHVNVYPLANDVATLIWFAQLSALELHVPQWNFGPGNVPENPDRMVFDLDPGEGVGLRECVEVARLVRSILTGMGLETVPVTSGSKGIHLYAPLDGATTSDEISSVAKELARSLEADHPDDIVSKMKRSERVGKVFIDWSQNNASKTTIAPYSLRGRARPWVAAPRTWRELSSPHLKHLEMHEVLDRVKRRGDPMGEMFAGGRKAGTRVRESHDTSDDPAPRDRLELYRLKRDPTYTPEPVPTAQAKPRSEQPVFVIQRHDARRLHYDFRLEHDGVLVSWALPKGVPTHPGRNHLAIRTEDHPLEYRFFEGDIPQGQYGGGTVDIWDAGTIEIETWRNDHVTVTMHGAPDGGLGGSPKRFALFATHRGDTSWLIHLTQEQPETVPTSPVRGHIITVNTRAPSPMLATLATEAEISTLDPHDWVFEGKWDGYRSIARVTNGQVHLMSRNHRDITLDYPELSVLGDVPLDSVTLDGEIVAFNREGITDFSLMQHGDAPVTFLAFDVLEVNGIETMRLPYRHRREVLNDLAQAPGDAWRVPPVLDAPTPVDAMAEARALGLEGVIAKRGWSIYRPGLRTREWRKFPFQQTAEVVIIGWRESETDAAGFASVLVAVAHRDTPTARTQLRYAGRVGTGFSSRERRELRAQLATQITGTPEVPVPSPDHRDATWVRPDLVGEVTYKGVTSHGKLRQASWRGLRPDKNSHTLSPVD